ncbi:hypothetical protein CEXT_255601 [Caerostris extrusa]|uniref:Uncharacterized protein n=1 Tax=Caerostris extrusa TaxID=172846 RepID=A0AAV4TQZ9_CAEEX|nr:hypothetical protein CEXT_255601 [Caerostris extrusa]
MCTNYPPTDGVLEQTERYRIWVSYDRKDSQSVKMHAYATIAIESSCPYRRFIPSPHRQWTTIYGVHNVMPGRQLCKENKINIAFTQTDL